MKTLETMVEGTKIGAYLTVIYSVIVVAAAGLTLFFQLSQAIEREELNTHNVAQYYQLQESSAHELICHQGMLHYRNVGSFSGLLSFNPNISCSESQLRELQDNPSLDNTFVAFIFLLIGLLGLLVSYLGLKK